MGRRPKVSHGIALAEGEERAIELAAMEQLIQVQIAHIWASSVSKTDLVPLRRRPRMKKRRPKESLL